MDKSETKFGIGGVWESPRWSVQYDVDTSTYTKTENGRVSDGPERPCRHAVDGRVDTPPQVYLADPQLTLSPATLVLTKWTVPRVVVAWNEGGPCSTGICLDCILEAAAKLDGTWPDCDDRSHAQGNALLSEVTP